MAKIEGKWQKLNSGGNDNNNGINGKFKKSKHWTTEINFTKTNYLNQIIQNNKIHLQLINFPKHAWHWKVIKTNAKGSLVIVENK